MIRIQISSTDGGPSNYSIDSNPSVYESQDSRYLASFHANSGDWIYTQSKVDDRIRTMKWTKYLLTSPYVATVANYFRSIEGSIRWFNFASIGDSTVEPRWRTSSDWKKARVIAVKATYERGGKTGLRYDELSIELQPE